MQQKTFGGRAPPGSAGGAYSAPPDALTGFREKGRKGKDRREGKEGRKGQREGEGRGKDAGKRKGKGREGKGKEKQKVLTVMKNSYFRPRPPEPLIPQNCYC